MGSKTGGNTEPMPFVRKWGAAATDTNGATDNGNIDPLASEVAGPELPPPDDDAFSRKKDKERSRSRSKDRKRDRKRSRSRDRKKRSRSRERKSKRSRSRSPRERKRSRDRKRSRSRDRRDRSKSRDRRRERDRTTPEPATPAGPREPVINPLLRPEVVAELAAAQMAKPPEEQALALLPSAEKKRERKSRWSEHKSFIPGMPTILPPDLPDEQRAAYLLQMEVEDATRKLRLGAFDPPGDPSQRSPSPEPVYDANGKRLNTRDVRKRQELEQFRHEKIQQLVKLNPNFKPPTDYRPPNIKLHDKVWIPQDAHPELNFVGLLIGPRGNTLKSLEMETGAKIIIRGKGSIKEGKLANRMGPMPGENEPLHAYVTAGDQPTIKKACDRIRQIIAEATCIPDGQNALRQLQLRELALLNGTFRPEDMIGGGRCSNCGSDEHKTWDCPEAPNVTASIICASCGGAGHLTRDCLNPRPGGVPAMPDMASIDSEYDALMQELGGGERPSNPVPAPEANAAKPPQPFTLPGMQNKNRSGYMGAQAHYQNAFDPQRLQSQAQAWAAQQQAQQAAQQAGTYQDPSANFYSSPGAQRSKNQAYTDGSFYGSSTPVQPVPPPSQARFQPPPPPPPPPVNSSTSSDNFLHLLRAPPPPPPQ